MRHPLALIPLLCALAACDGGTGGGGAPLPTTAGGPLRIAVIPKYVGNEYFNSCEAGARKAAAELGVDLTYDGPAQQDASKQLEFINTCIIKKVHAICIAPLDPNNVASAVERARGKGIKVLTWDTDAPRSGRDLMVNQADGAALGRHAMDVLAAQAGGKGEFGILLGSPTAENLNYWRRHIEARAKETHPGMKHVDTRFSDEKREKGIDVTGQMIDAFPNLVGILGIDSVSFPAAAEAVRQKGKKGKISVTGFSTPNDMRQYVKDGTVKTVILWSPVDLGELTVRLAHHLVKGGKAEDGMELPGWKGGKLKVQPTRDNPEATEVILGPPTDFTAENIDRYDF